MEDLEERTVATLKQLSDVVNQLVEEQKNQMQKVFDLSCTVCQLKEFIESTICDNMPMPSMKTFTTTASFSNTSMKAKPESAKGEEAQLLKNTIVGTEKIVETDKIEETDEIVGTEKMSQEETVRNESVPENLVSSEPSGPCYELLAILEGGDKTEEDEDEKSKANEDDSNGKTVSVTPSEELDENDTTTSTMSSDDENDVTLRANTRQQVPTVQENLEGSNIEENLPGVKNEKSNDDRKSALENNINFDILDSDFAEYPEEEEVEKKFLVMHGHELENSNESPEKESPLGTTVESPSPSSGKIPRKTSSHPESNKSKQKKTKSQVATKRKISPENPDSDEYLGQGKKKSKNNNDGAKKMPVTNNSEEEYLSFSDSSEKTVQMHTQKHSSSILESHDLAQEKLLTQYSTSNKSSTYKKKGQPRESSSGISNSAEKFIASDPKLHPKASYVLDRRLPQVIMDTLRSHNFINLQNNGGRSRSGHKKNDLLREAISQLNADVLTERVKVSKKKQSSSSSKQPSKKIGKKRSNRK